MTRLDEAIARTDEARALLGIECECDSFTILSADWRVIRDAAIDESRRRADGDLDEWLRDRLQTLLTRTATVLRGEPPTGEVWGWDNIPELVEAVVAERDRLKDGMVGIAHFLKSIDIRVVEVTTEESAVSDFAGYAKSPRWWPIETGPRDGTGVILWHKDGYYVRAYWHDGLDEWRAISDEREFDANDFTHWAPELEPPK